MTLREVHFTSPTVGPLTIDGILERVMEYVKADPKSFYKIIVGTDSNGNGRSSFITAITVWRVGGGAIYFWTKNYSDRVFHTLRDRIWEEAMRSLTLAQELRSLLTDALGDDFFWDGNEIHVDIGENGLTKEFITSVKGLVMGYDFKPVIKPEAFVASSIADRHT